MICESSMLNTVGVSLLDLVEQDNGVRPATDALG
jgi:hypothetical protein